MIFPFRLDTILPLAELDVRRWLVRQFSGLKIHTERHTQLYLQALDVGNVDDTEFTFASFPAAVNETSNYSIHVKAFGTFSADVRAKTLRFYFGPDVVASAGTPAISKEHWFIEGFVIVHSTNPVMRVRFWLDGTLETYTVPITVPFNEEQIIKVTGQASVAAANDIKINYFQVEELKHVPAYFP